jgi:glycosyltransferase involved in cell wall biosynthesis
VNPSLSVILPVRNAQDRLAPQVANLLEIIPDLTPDFEITIIDDGSTDHTFEVAQELAREYPQVQVRRHSLSHGHTVSVETGLRHTTGEIVFVQDEHAPISPTQLQRLWRMRADRRLVMARSDPGHPGETAGTVQRLMRWAAKMNKAQKPDAAHWGTEMIRRSTVAQLGNLTDPTCHLAVHHSVRADQQQHEPLANESPNFLLRLKELVAREVAAHRARGE